MFFRFLPAPGAGCFPWRLGVGAVLLAAALSVGAADAGDQPAGAQYSPPGLYDPVIYRLDNGLRVILKPRDHIRNVEIRAVVGVGQAHFPCGRQQVPHFLEHMLFAAIPGVSESEFEQRMFEIGAYSNATTNLTDTVYELGAYTTGTPEVLELLGRMLFVGELGRESFRLTRDIIRRESGGEPNLYERWLAGADQKTSAFQHAVRDLSTQRFASCPGIDTGADVTLEAVRAAYRDHYAPQATTLVLVGDFTVAQARGWVDAAFGAYPRKDGTSTPALPAVKENLKPTYEGVSTEPGIGIVGVTGGYLAEDYYARVLLRHYLDNRLYQRLRVESGLTYTPSVETYDTPRHGLFGIYAELPEDAAGRARAIIREEIARLTDGRLDTDTFRAARRSLLLRWAQSTETNAGFADYYANWLPELGAYGRFRNDEVAVAALTVADLQHAAQAVFAPDNVTLLQDSAFNDRVQWVIAGAGGVALLAVLGLGGWVAARRRRRVA